MRTSRTANLILAGTFGFGTLVAMASPAFAETPPHQPAPMVISNGEGGGGFQGPTDLAPAPTPESDVDDIAPAPQPEPPAPQPELPVAQPTGHGDPEPEGDLPIANPEQDDQDPIDGPGDLTSEPGCTLTHGCPEDVPTPDGHCFDEAGEVVDPSECIPTDGDEPADSSDTDTGVLGSSTDRGALPRTGAGLALMALAGGALTGAGAALRKVARR